MEHVLVIAGVIWLAAISLGAHFAMITRLSAVQSRRSGLIAAAGIDRPLVPCGLRDLRLGADRAWHCPGFVRPR
ncbi:MAG: hypothetical protein EOP66_05725 [Sphingomonas sp.]|nr:MAG: hypothetical protein EOP66_05725 [Sphingomonas sp.]